MYPKKMLIIARDNETKDADTIEISPLAIGRNLLVGCFLSRDISNMSLKRYIELEIIQKDRNPIIEPK